MVRLPILVPAPLEAKEQKERVNKLLVTKKRKKTWRLSSKSSGERWNGKKKNLKKCEMNSKC